MLSSLEHKISLIFSPGLIPINLIFLDGEIAFARSVIFTEGIFGTKILSP